MSTHVHRVGSFEAKTRLAELLRRTEKGESFIVERRGRPIARLVPFVDPDKGGSFASLAGELAQVRAGIRGKLPVRSLVEEGRRR